MPEKKWGILVYMAADNDLSQDAIYEIGQIRETFAELGDKLGNVEFFLYFDGDAYGFPSLSFDFRRRSGKPIEHKREYRTSPESIYRFAQYWRKKGLYEGITDFALVISSHGFGFQEASLLKDNSPGTSTTVKQLAGRIRDLNKNELGGKLRILGFDSCVMGELEVAYEMLNDDGSPNFDYQVSSEGYVPNANWGYSQILRNIAATNGADLSSKDMAELFVNSYVEEYGLSERYGGEAFDISAMKMAAVADLAVRVNKLGASLKDAVTNEKIQREVERLILSAHSNSQTYLFDQCIDIKDFCEQLWVEIDSSYYKDYLSDLLEAIEPITALINPENFYSRNLGAEAQWSTGVSLYFPWSYFSFLFTESSYRGLRFGHIEEYDGQLCSWGDFMLRYLFQTMRDYRYDPASEDNRKMHKNVFEASHRKTWFGFELGGIEVAEGHKIDPKVKDKIDPKVKDKLNPPKDSKLGVKYVENFRRTLNFPWLPEMAIDRLTSRYHRDQRDVLHAKIKGPKDGEPTVI